LQETFKRVERDHKTTRFSRAGLERDETDPALVAKIKCADWLNDIVTQLETQIEQQEADLEALGPAAMGKSKSKSSGNAANAAAAEKAKELSFQISRHTEYISKVERVLRLLENDQVTPEEVEHALKDSLEYFVEAAYEEGAAFIEDEEIWSLLPLDAVEENVGKIAVHVNKASNSQDLDSEEETEVDSKNGVSKGGSGDLKLKEKVSEVEAREEGGEDVAAEVIAGGSSVHATPMKEADESSSLADDVMVHLPPTTDGSATSATTVSPLVSPPGFSRDGGGGGGGAAVAPSPSSSECSPPPGFPHRIPVAMPQQQQQPAVVYGNNAAAASVPGSPFAGAATPLNDVSQQQQQQKQQQRHSSEEGSVNSNDLPGGGGSGASGAGFRTPFAVKASTAFTPQPSLDAPSSNSSSYFPTAPPAATARTGAAPAAVPTPPGYYPQEGGAQQAQHAPPPPSHHPSPLNPSPLGADWFSFSASWIGEADSQHGAATATTGGPRMPWLPTPHAVSIIDAGAMHHRPITGDADWRRSDGVISTPADEFNFSSSGGSIDGAGGGGGSGGRPPWRPRFPTCAPLSYPNEVHPALTHETTFNKLQLETLFFSFFFHQGSRQQLFAANRLKLQGWRYHTKLSTWFARTMQPAVANENYEEGVMAYWDPILRAVQLSSSGGTGDGHIGGPGGGPVMGIGGWSQGTTAPNFRFEYSLLENEDTSCPSG
jgi:CCR4-NOT transcription complex subunit 3